MSFIHIPGKDAVDAEIERVGSEIAEKEGYLDGLSELGIPLVKVDEVISGLQEDGSGDQPVKLKPEMRIERQPLPEIKPVEVAPDVIVRGTIAEAKLRLRENGSPTERIELDYIKARREKRHGPSSK